MGQCASAVILIRPTGFGYDPETAESNTFQRTAADADVREQAAREFDGLIEALRQCGIRVTVLDPVDRDALNGVFPNNWFSTHADGTVVLYPMLTASRRKERDPGIGTALIGEGYAVQKLIDHSSWERDGRILEGTGSLVLDRVAKLAFACISPRTDPGALSAWCEAMSYTPVTFTATVDGTLGGQPIYHTNVLMSIGERFAVVCFEAMPFPAERQEVEEELSKTGKAVIPISLEQMHFYLGNLLELKPTSGLTQAFVPPVEAFIFLSRTAFNTLSSDQRIALQVNGQLVPVDIPTIESVGGGSVRCMLAENFLPLRS